MYLVKKIIKGLMRNTLSPRLQREVRHFYLSKQVVHGRGFREEEMRVLKFFIGVGDTAADIGANIGVYTKEMSSLVGEKGRVLSFEPIPENFEILQTVIRKSHLDNVSLWTNALGAKKGKRQMIIPELGGFTGYYWAHFLNREEVGQGMTVEVLTLDDLWKQGDLPGLDFIKCDVEGSEWEVIQGGLCLIRSQLPAWLIEVNRKTSGQVFKCLLDLGYRSFIFNERLCRVDGYRDKEYSNYFFVHPDSKIWNRMSPLVDN